MKCTKCGYQLQPGDAFCSNCGSFALPLKESPEKFEIAQEEPGSLPSHKVVERLYPPPGGEFAGEHGEALKDQPEQINEVFEDYNLPTEEDQYSVDFPVKKTGKGWKIFAVICCLLMLVAVGISVYIVMDTSSMRVQLRMSQRENTTSQASIESLEAQVESLEDNLESVASERQSLMAQVSELESQISEMETSVYQNTNDRENAERQLEEAQSELAAVEEALSDLEVQLQDIQEQLAAAQEENETLTGENEALSQKVSTYEAQLNFYDTYVVFVMLSSSDKYYHKYSCSTFTQRNFLAYSVKLAEANGYEACPICFGGTVTTDDETEDDT